MCVFLASVCIEISDYTLNIVTTTGNITEERNSLVTCQTNGADCVFQCLINNKYPFNGSSDCLEASKTPLNGSTGFLYDIYNYTKCYKYLCIQSSVVQIIKFINSTDHGRKDMLALHSIRNSCQALFATNHEFKKAYIAVEKEIIHDIMAASKPEEGKRTTHNQFLSVNVYNLKRNNLSLINDTMQLEGPQLPLNNESLLPEIWLPVNAANHIMEKSGIIGVVSYMQYSQFQLHRENISSMVLRLEVLGQRLQNLKPPIKMIFRVNQTNVHNDSHLLCQYFDEYGRCMSGFTRSLIKMHSTYIVM
ncbi:uncharacterized protein LOC119617736 [Kryptolebias marmoratus]|uniref:uncharacterized protein LOC119617736 n=1 Tax=Kryptolebias marmoratus TaxID=37003 RepID=UPI0018AC9AF5|nr:uncharacterized protein LOC119617736 [Kryptolebias marmoratus]